jgi:hypothetical protein
MLHYQGDGHFIHLPKMKTKTTKAKEFQRSPHVYNHLKIIIRHLAKTYRKQYFSGVLGIEQFELVTTTVDLKITPELCVYIIEFLLKLILLP